MKRLVLLVFVLFLSACGSNPPAPVDRYYRLQPTLSPAAAPLRGVVLMPIRAESLYAERPLVYTEEASPRQLRQYHYHLWLYPPAQLVQEQLAAALGLGDAANGRSQSPLRVEGRIVRFDRVLAGRSGKAVVAVELRLARGEQVLSKKVYTAEQAAAADTLDAHIEAVERALATITTEFQADLRKAL